jgi:putative transcriptional regulator
MPHMADPFFQKSLVFICEHDADGAMGVIVNKPMPSENVQDVLTQTGLNQLKPLPDVYFGGPVGVDMGLFLHDNSYHSEGELKIGNKIVLTANNQIIIDLIENSGPLKYLFSLGYAGWGKGQLEREIEDGDWLVMPAENDFIFDLPNHKKWKNAATHFGIDINSFSGGQSGKA